MSDAGHTTAPPSSLWRSVKMVGCAFLGIRKSHSVQDDAAPAKPWHIVVIGIALAATFVLLLIALVQWVAP